MEESLLGTAVDAPHAMLDASQPTVASEGMLHAPMPQVIEMGAPVTQGATLSQAMDRTGVTMRQSMRAPFACLCCEPNFDYTIHDYAPTYDEGQHLPTLFYIKEDSPYTHNGCPNRPCQHCLPGCKKTTYTAYTGDQACNMSASTTEDDAPQLPGIDPNNVIMTHSKGLTCGHSCGFDDKRFLCCCCLPYLETHDNEGKLLGSTKYICDLWCFVPKFAVNDEFGTEVYRVRPDTCCFGCCTKCVIGQAGGRCCSIPFKLRDPTTHEPVQDAEVTELWAGIKKAWYFWVYTSMPLTMRTASTLAGLHDAMPRSVWNVSSSKGYWAPELHYWGAPYSTWFIYTVYEGGQIQVLRSHTGRADGPFQDAGFVANAGNGSAGAIDPNLLHHPSGKKYLLVKGERMWLTELASPSATIGPSLQLPCIKCPLPGNQWYEAPATWIRGDKIWLMYSRCNTGPNYEIMLAYCDTNDDVMKASSWHHFSDDPVVRGNGGDTTGPGHSGWFSSPSGEQTWVVYHATAVGESGRSSRAMEIPFNSTGWPVFPTTLPPLGEDLPEPS